MEQSGQQFCEHPLQGVREKETRAADLVRQSVEHYRILYETMLQGVMYHDAEGRVVSANPAALRIFGMTLETIQRIGELDFEFGYLREDGSPFPMSERPSLLALRSGEPQRDMVIKVYNPQLKRFRWISFTAVPLFRDEEERPSNVYTLFDDITERKEAERALREREERLSLVLRGSRDAFWDWNLVKNEVTYSERWWDMLGYGEGQVREDQDLWRSMMHPDDQVRVGLVICNALEGSTDSYETEFRLLHADGHCVSVISRAFILRDADGNPTRVSGTNMDITIRRQMEDDLLQHKNKLKLANELLEQRVNERTADLESAIHEQESFSYSVSHDLRAPLRHINSFSAMLIEDYGGNLPQEAHGYLDRIRSATSRMGALIDHLLELSRVSRTEIRLDSVDLSDLALQVLRMYQETEPLRCVEISVAESITVLGDRPMLRQLLENLLGNAWKYTSRKPSARIEFGMTHVAGEEAFFVGDDGAGFDMAYGQRLFNAFERLHGPEFEGVGIGLATAQRIIKRHGGKIWAEGRVGEGATFYFTLPVYY